MPDSARYRQLDADLVVERIGDLQHFDDDVAVAAVTEVEELCLGLSRKVWQKIMIVHQDPRYGAGLAVAEG